MKYSITTSPLVPVVITILLIYQLYLVPLFIAGGISIYWIWSFIFIQKEKNLLKDNQIDYLKQQIKNYENQANNLIEVQKQTQNLIDQQQRLALQDKKVLEEYKSEINELKSLKMPQEDMKDGSSIRGEAQEEIERLKAQLKLSEEERNKAKEKEPVKTESKKWRQLWK